MRAKFVATGMTLFVVVALVWAVSAIGAIGQDNANKPAGNSNRRATHRKHTAKRAEAGVPKGVPECINKLAQLAAADPLIAYEGRPSEIVNNGLLWNDPKSHCAVSDEATRAKIVEMSTAWQTKDAAKVRSILQELGGTAGASSEAPPATEKPAGRRGGKGHTKKPRPAAKNSNM